MEDPIEAQDSNESSKSQPPSKPAQGNSPAKPSFLQQRLRREVDAFNFNALIEGVSTLKKSEDPAEETSGPTARTGDSEELRRNFATSTEAIVHSNPRRASVQLPDFDLEMPIPASAQRVMATAYERAVASTLSAHPSYARATAVPLDGSSSDTPPESSSARPSSALRITQGAQRGPRSSYVGGQLKRRRNGRYRSRLSLIAALSGVFVLGATVVAALTWRAEASHHAARVRVAPVHSTRVVPAVTPPPPASPVENQAPHPRRRRHNRHRRRISSDGVTG